MLQLLKESVSSRHAERLEQIVIALIAIEIGENRPTVRTRHTDPFSSQFWALSPYSLI